VSDNIGWATLSVIPGMAGFGTALSAGVEPELAAAGLAGGSVFGKSFALGAAAAVAGVALIGVAATKMAADYQTATTLLVTGAGESEAAIGQVRQGLLDMAPAVGMGPTALAQAMFLVESAGFHGAAGLTVMNAAAQGAKIGGADATVVADGLTTAMTDYHYSADQANTVTSKLVQTVALGKTNMGDLSGALSNVLPFAANLKISFNDVMGAMATMTSQGIGAAQASTMLKFGMMALANETPKGASALASIGMTTQQVVTDLGTKGLGGTLAEITTAIGKTFPAGSAEAVSALSDIVGGTRGMGMALALTGQNAATMTANTLAIAGAVTEADGSVKGWTLTQGDLNTQLDQVGAFLSSVGIKLGTVLIPAVLQGTEGFRAFAAEFENGTGAGGRFRDVLSGIGGFLTLLYNDAVKPLVPAIQGFVQGFKDGTGAGGAFRDILTSMYNDGLKPFANFITDTALPNLKKIEDWITGSGGTSLGSLKQFWKDNKTDLKGLATFITTVLLPVFADMAAKAVASAATQVGAWISVQVAAGESAGYQLASHYTAIAGWILHASTAVSSALGDAGAWISLRVEAATSAAAEVGAHILASDSWVGHAATAVVSALGDAGAWVSLRVEAATSAASEVASHVLGEGGWIAHAATAVTSALGDAGAWISLKTEAGVSAASEVASHALGEGGWIAHAATAVSSALADAGAWVSLRVEAATSAAAELASHALGEGGWIAGAATAVTSAAVQVGAWITTAATATASSIEMAAAWVVGLGPIAWIIAGIAALVAAFVWAYDNIGWFRDGVNTMCTTVGNSFVTMWNTVIEPVLTFLIGGLVNVMTMFGNMLVTLGQVPNFGWATTAGNAVLGAAGAVATLASNIKTIPPTTNVAINVKTVYSTVGAPTAGNHVAVAAASGGTFAPTPGGTIVRVAEAGRKETIVDTATLNAAMAQKQSVNNPNASVTFDYDRLAAAMARVQIGLDGRAVSQSVDQRIGGLLR
jgi:TP901 family phage tail tape measure protein